MDPFAGLGVAHDATDDQVEARYRTLVRRFPPDRDPEAFSIVAQAYERIRTAEGRARAVLFAADGAGAIHELVAWLRTRSRKPLSGAALGELIRGESR